MKPKIIIRPLAGLPDPKQAEAYKRLGRFMNETRRLPEASEVARRKYKPAPLPMQLPPF